MHGFAYSMFLGLKAEGIHQIPINYINMYYLNNN